MKIYLYILFLFLIPSLSFSQIVISGNGEIAASGTANIILSGDWTNNATNTGFTGSTGAGLVYFKSTIAQNINGSKSTTFSKLKVKNTNPSSLTVNTDIIITDTMTFKKGIVHSSSVMITFLGNNSKPRRSSVYKFIDGPVTRIGSSAFLFPIGEGIKYAPIRTYNPGSSPVTVTAQYHKVIPPNNSSVALPLKKISDVEYWHITSVDNPDTRVRIFWRDGAESGIGSIHPDTLKFAKWDGSNWVDEPASIAATSTLTKGYISTTAKLNLTDLYVTFGTTNILENPLPISLIDFSAKAKQEEVILDWSTATEINNDYFTIEKSEDGVVWQKINDTPGNGNSNQIVNYYLADNNPYKGISYYRLSQTDYDGTHTFIDIKSVYFNSNKLSEAKIYPNPTKGIVNIEFDNDISDNDIRLYNSLGQDNTPIIEVLSNTDNLIKISISNLATGLYTLKLGNETTKIYKQ